MAFKEWHKLPVSVRRSRENLYNYIKEEIEGGSEDESPEPTTHDISITINDGTNPVQGASVFIGNVTKTTGSAGGCTFADLSEGDHEVTISADGFNEYSGTITVDDTNTSFTLSLTRIIYDFTSYSDAEKTETYATGTAQLTGTVSGDYSEIEVLTNTVEDFIGNKYYILSEAEADGTTAYELFNDAGSDGSGIFVTVSVHE